MLTWCNHSFMFYHISHHQTVTTTTPATMDNTTFLATFVKFFWSRLEKWDCSMKRPWSETMQGCQIHNKTCHRGSRLFAWTWFKSSTPPPSSQRKSRICLNKIQISIGCVLELGGMISLLSVGQQHADILLENWLFNLTFPFLGPLSEEIYSCNH